MGEGGSGANGAGEGGGQGGAKATLAAYIPARLGAAETEPEAEHAVPSSVPWVEFVTPQHASKTEVRLSGTAPHSPGLEKRKRVNRCGMETHARGSVPLSLLLARLSKFSRAVPLHAGGSIPLR